MRWKRLTKPRFLFVYPVGAALFFSARITEASFRLGVALIVLGELVRLWANGYVGHRKVNVTQPQRGDRRIGRLITAGPYGFVRHPLYAGTLLIGAGFCLAVQNAWLAAAALAGFLMSYRGKMDEEEQILQEEHPEAFARYQAAVPRLLPRLIPYPASGGSWSWTGVAASKEWKTATWLVIMTILVYFWEEFVQERKWVFHERAAFRWFLLGMVVLLMAADGIIELALRRHAASIRMGGNR